jgi:hypothetical protein
MEKLDRLLPKWLVAWIANWLSGRKQRVKVNGKCTEWKPVEASVIQGSALGPILFLIYIADINGYIPEDLKLLLVKYADDLLLSSSSCLDNPGHIQAGLDAISAWADDNQASLNEKKTVQMIINGRKGNTLASAATLNGQQLGSVSKFKYLGFILTDDGSYDEHWHHVYSSMCSNAYLLKQLKKIGFRTEILVTLYKSLFLSHFAYSAPILTSASAQVKSEMEALQRRAMNIIGVSADDARLKYNIIPVTEFIDNICTRVMSRVLANNEHPITVKYKKQVLRESRSAKNGFVYRVPTCKTARYKNSFVPKYLRALRDGRSDLYTNAGEKKTVTTSRRRIHKATATRKAPLRTNRKTK